MKARHKNSLARAKSLLDNRAKTRSHPNEVNTGLLGHTPNANPTKSGAPSRKRRGTMGVAAQSGGLLS